MVLGVEYNQHALVLTTISCADSTENVLDKVLHYHKPKNYLSKYRKLLRNIKRTR